MLTRFGRRPVILLALALVIVLLPLVFPSSYYFRVAALVWVSALSGLTSRALR